MSEEVEIEVEGTTYEPAVPKAAAAVEAQSDTVVVRWLHESVKFAKVGEPIELERNAAWGYYRRRWCTKPSGPKPEPKQATAAETPKAVAATERRK